MEIDNNNTFNNNGHGNDFIADVSRSSFPDWSDEKIEERIKEIESEKESLEYSLTRLENELFYRRNPECRK
jgi:hypothetical protein